MPTIGDSTRTKPFDGRGDRRGSGSGIASGAADEAAPPCASAVERTETRIPSSSIVTSPMPDSWTMRTTSRMRSARALSTAASSSSSRARAAADRAQQPLGVLAEEPEQQQLLLARRHALRLLAQLAQRRDDVLAASRDRA